MQTDERMKNELKRSQKRLKEIKQEYRKLPNGRLECHRRKSRNGKNVTYRWFIVKNGKRTILPKTECHLAEQLAYKRKLQEEMGQLENRIIALSTYIGVVNGEGSKYLTSQAKRSVTKNLHRRLTVQNEEVDRLAQNYHNSTHKNWAEWATEDYNDKDFHKDEYTVQSITGRWVRSRIEAMIEASLYNHGLYYRYEPPYHLDGMWIHPDFEIMNPKTCKTVLWEHLGKMHDPDYVETNIRKFAAYVHNGYYPNKNLILTSETDDKYIDAQLIEAIIEYFFE